MNKQIIIYFLLTTTLIFILTGCVSRQSQLAATEILSDEQLAQSALLEFLENLHSGKYAEAAQFYGGSYETIRDHNSDIDPNDHAALLRNACTLNGMQCLRGKIVGLEEKVPGEKFVFMVELIKDDGTLFVLGPCCGGDETSSPPQSVFLFTIMKVDQNKYVVTDLPPYVP